MKNKAFTLAETLIVIGIIGVVAALTLPNLNHATGDKETVTRVKKIYSSLCEANDRAIATYGPISEWSEECRYNLRDCYAKRLSEFLKTAKTCFTDDENYDTCEPDHGDLDGSYIMLSDGAIIGVDDYDESCTGTEGDEFQYKDICIDVMRVDINGINKGKNEDSYDTFSFMVSDSAGVLPRVWKGWLPYCTAGNDLAAKWILDFENLDYLKIDGNRKCNDNPSIILDGVNNTSCH